MIRQGSLWEINRMKLNQVFSALAIFAAVCLPLTLAHADDLQKIEKAGKLSIALSGAFPPFSFVDENNNVVGFDVDIGNAIAKRLKVQPEIVTTAWDGIIAGLATGRYDAIIGSMSITEERKKAVDFVGPYYRSGLAVFVKKGADVKNVDALKGKAIGVTLGEAAEKWAREQNMFEIRTYKGLPEMLLDLNAGRVNAIVADDVPVFVAIAKSNAPVEQVKDDRMPRYDIGMAIRKGNPELAAAMQRALDDMMKDGTYEAISKKWIGHDIR